MNDLMLKKNLESTFNIKKANINEPIVLISMITAASKMANCSSVVTEQTTIEQLLDLYQKSDNNEITSLIGIGSQYVKNNIGYAVDFNDIESALIAYQANKQVYDKIYSDISQRAMNMSKGPVR